MELETISKRHGWIHNPPEDLIFPFSVVTKSSGHKISKYVEYLYNTIKKLDQTEKLAFFSSSVRTSTEIVPTLGHEASLPRSELMSHRPFSTTTIP